jgi:hypothetical protein
MVHLSGRVVLSDLDVRNQRTGSSSHALFVTCGNVSVNNCTITSQGGPGAAVTHRTSSLSLENCAISPEELPRVYLSGGMQTCVPSASG